MQKQSGTRTALYYRVANNRPDGLYLDNQMTKLLCYAKEQGLDSFTLYADVNKSGATLDRPAFNALIADIEAGQIGTLIVNDFARIARDFILTDKFIEWAQARGVVIVSIMDGILTEPPYTDILAFFREYAKGGGRA